jgi:ubiquinone/menaquinone biosynthesis C-methylase UbiE
VTATTRDKWADWLLERRHGGDTAALERAVQELAPVRDRVLDDAAIAEGDVVLDVGCGDGLIAFGALDRVGGDGRVIFSDVSASLLDRCRELADETGALDRSDFVQARAEDLGPIPDASVDVVTTRSVIIYVPLGNKPRVFEEFFRVLRPGGRIAMFEPINRFGWPEADERFFGFDMGPVLPLARKVRAVYAQATGEQTLIDFDERDLIAFAERAGFSPVQLTYEAEVRHGNGMCWGDVPPWDVFLRSSGNPCAPTLEEALDAALTRRERERFVAYLRPLVEAGAGTVRMAKAHLRARKRT